MAIGWQYGRSAILSEGRLCLVEVYQALSLMFMFGMFIMALLSYLSKKK